MWYNNFKQSLKIVDMPLWARIHIFIFSILAGSDGNVQGKSLNIKKRSHIMSNLIAQEYKCFEDIKHTKDDGTEYWFARELAIVLDYSKWENFHKVIKRAMIACENSGHDITYDFPEVRKIVKAGATEKPVIDYELTRYACYLIVQNGDPRKEVIALGQTYFAIQTYRQEVADRFNQLDEDSRRLVVRGDIKQWYQLLAETARNAGVITNEEFAIFQNAGYIGLYGGLDVEDIHKRIGITRTIAKISGI